jgi:hypothetical protein
MEGTWQTPDTPEKQARLIELLSQDLPVGADATNATEQLYDLLGDDELFDQLQALADRDANADARQIVLNRMQELGQDPDVMKVITSLNIDDKYAMNPPEQTPADLKSVDEMLGGDASDEFIRDISIKEPRDEMEEAVKDPADQTEDPEGTKQPAYPEYAQDLSSILKHAGVPAQEKPAPDYEEEVAETANPGVTPADIDGVPTEELDEASRCNMSEAGESCPVHGLKECGMEEGWGLTAVPTAESALQGQYGHTGRMKSVAEDTGFLTRLKELSGMIRN